MCMYVINLTMQNDVRQGITADFINNERIRNIYLPS